MDSVNRGCPILLARYDFRDYIDVSGKEYRTPCTCIVDLTYNYQKNNFPSCPSVERSVGCSVGRSIIISKKKGWKLHFQALIEALVNLPV